MPGFIGLKAYLVPVLLLLAAVPEEAASLLNEPDIGTQKFAEADLKCKVRIYGVNVLRLEICCPGSKNAGHTIWVDPQLLR